MFNILTIGDVGGGYRVIELAQDGAFWIGIIMVIYALVEAMLDYSNWRKRLFAVVMFYVGILIAPIVFLEIKNSLQPELRYRFIKSQNEIEQRINNSTTNIDQENIDAIIKDVVGKNNLSEEEVREIVLEILSDSR